MRAVIYCRVSTQQQTKNLSLPAQRKECVRFCKAQGWTVDRVFVERGESAKSADRTELTIEPDPEVAPLVRRAFELYAKGVHSKREVLEQVTILGLRTKLGNKMSPQSFGQMLKHPLYAGRIRNDKWGIDVRGDFEPIVDEHTFHRAQLAMRKAASTGERRFRNNPDFPLRRFVRCRSCDSPLTGSWARSKTGKRYAYYHCHRCRTTSLRKEVLEERFLELLDRLKPTKKNLQALKETVLLVWRRRKEELDEMRPLLERSWRGSRSRSAAWSRPLSTSRRSTRTPTAASLLGSAKS